MKAKNEIKKNVSEKQTQSKNQQIQQKVSFDFDFKVVSVSKEKRAKRKKYNWAKLFHDLAKFIVQREVSKIKENGFEITFEQFTDKYMIHGEYDGKSTINYQLCIYNYGDEKSIERVKKNYQKISEIANNLFQQLNKDIRVRVKEIIIEKEGKTLRFGIEYEKI